jgi:hypothetical protein
MHFLFWYDFALFPIYMVIAIVFLNSYFRKKYGRNRELKKHFNRGLILKLIGCISIALIYEYYYNGAYDGISYFNGGKMLSNYWQDKPAEFLHVIFSNMDNFNDSNLNGLSSFDAGIFANESFSVAKITAIFDLFSFNAFLPCSLFFCIFAFLALWNFFIFLIREYHLPTLMAGFCTIYIPSVLFWDSGIFKDTITFTALLWMFMCGYYSFIKPRKVIANLLGFALSAIIIATVKVYIVAAFAPFFILYIFGYYRARLKSEALRVLALPFILLISGVLIIVFLQNASELLGKYSVEQVLETASKTYSGIISAGEAGSAYNINTDLSSPAGILSALPVGINVTLFRPYPWEYAKPFILFASLESMIFLFLTLFVIFKVGVGRTLKSFATIPLLQFCLPFSLLFAFMVGVSSSNFGTLVRYKIPCLPFYSLFLATLYLSKYGSKTKARPTHPQHASSGRMIEHDR